MTAPRTHLENSVSGWISRLRIGEARAAQELWNRFAVRLTELARRKLGSSPKSVVDEEDIAQSVFRSVCRGAALGRFQDVQNRDELWWLLLAITKQKVIDHTRRESTRKRGGGRVHSEYGATSRTPGREGLTLDQIVGDEPSPEFVVMLDEQNQRLLTLLRDDRLRRIAVSRIEGYTVSEIADELAVSTRSIERKLRLIRKAWAGELIGAN